MKENIYDNNKFFEKYSQFPRSVKGLSAAGEWHELRKMLPDFKGKRVLDIGCGFGWHCNYAAENGAAKVIGTDISEKMLDGASQVMGYLAPSVVIHKSISVMVWREWYSKVLEPTNRCQCQKWN